MARCTNAQPENIINTITTRAHIQLKTEVDDSLESFLKEQKNISVISEAADQYKQQKLYSADQELPQQSKSQCRNYILTHSFLFFSQY